MRLSEIMKKMILIIIALFLVFSAVGCAIFLRGADILAFSLGVFMMAFGNILKLVMLERSILIAVSMDEKSGANYMRAQYFLRFGLIAVILVAAAKMPFLGIARGVPITLWGAGAGIFTLPIAANIARLFVKDDESAAPGKPENADTNIDINTDIDVVTEEYTI